MIVESIWIDVEYQEFKPSTYRGVYALKIQHLDGVEMEAEEVGRVFTGDYEQDVEELKLKAQSLYPELDIYFGNSMDQFELDQLLQVETGNKEKLYLLT